MTELTSNMEELKQLIQTAEFDLRQLMTKGTKVSATRLRSKLMSITKICGGMRKDVLAHQKALPTRTRKAQSNEPEPEAETDSNTDDDAVPEPLVLERQVGVDKVLPKTKKTKGRKKKE